MHTTIECTYLGHPPPPAHDGTAATAAAAAAAAGGKDLALSHRALCKSSSSSKPIRQPRSDWLLLLISDDAFRTVARTSSSVATVLRATEPAPPPPVPPSAAARPGEQHAPLLLLSASADPLAAPGAGWALLVLLAAIFIWTVVSGFQDLWRSRLRPLRLLVFSLCVGTLRDRLSRSDALGNWSEITPPPPSLAHGSPIPPVEALPLPIDSI